MKIKIRNCISNSIIFLIDFSFHRIIPQVLRGLATSSMGATRRRQRRVWKRRRNDGLLHGPLWERRGVHRWRVWWRQWVPYSLARVLGWAGTSKVLVQCTNGKKQSKANQSEKKQSFYSELSWICMLMAYETEIYVVEDFNVCVAWIYSIFSHMHVCTC